MFFLLVDFFVDSLNVSESQNVKLITSGSFKQSFEGKTCFALRKVDSCHK